MANTRNYGKRLNLADGGAVDQEFPGYRPGMSDNDFRAYLNRNTADLWQDVPNSAFVDPNSPWAVVKHRKG